MTGRERVASRVSRETLEAFDVYVDLLEKWTPKINLISAATRHEIWDRHIDDSLQIVDLSPKCFAHWVDLGSGAGLPGLVAAIVHKHDPAKRFTLVESDMRKGVFLSNVIKELELNASVIAERIEAIPPLSSDILSARALAPLDVLLEFTHTHRIPNGIALFPKGQKAQTELTLARKNWHVDVVRHPSRTDAEACILEIGTLSRV